VPEHYLQLERELQEQEDCNFKGSLYMWNLDCAFSPVTRTVWNEAEAACQPLLLIAKHLYSKSTHLGSFSIVTQNTSRIEPGDYWVHPVSASALGFLKVMRLEYPHIRCLGI